MFSSRHQSLVNVVLHCILGSVSVQLSLFVVRETRDQVDLATTLLNKMNIFTTQSTDNIQFGTLHLLQSIL